MDQQQEQRLQRVEETVSDIKADLASVSTQIQLGFEAINAKLSRLDDLPARCTALEGVNQRRTTRTKFIAKVVGSALSAIIAAFALIFFGLKP